MLILCVNKKKIPLKHANIFQETEKKENCKYICYTNQQEKGASHQRMYSLCNLSCQDGVTLHVSDILALRQCKSFYMRHFGSPFHIRCFHLSLLQLFMKKNKDFKILLKKKHFYVYAAKVSSKSTYTHTYSNLV